MILSDSKHHRGGVSTQKAEDCGCSTKNDLHTLPHYWRTISERLKPYSPSASNAFSEAAADLEAALRNRDDEILSMREAGIESGYSSEYLSRLVRNGTIPNAGRHGAPRLRRGDLPSRNKSRVGRPSTTQYDPDTDARELLIQRHGGGV